MKKIFIIFVTVFLLTLCGCDKKEPPKTDKLTVHYYDVDEIIFNCVYKKDTFELYNYYNNQFEFINWYLDKDLTEVFDMNKLDEYFKKTEINLYAKTEKKIMNFNINIEGKIDNQVVLNPLFNWENEFNDSSFEVSLLKDDKIIINKTITESYYTSNSLLDVASNYSLKIKGTESNVETTITFTTINNKDDSINSINLSNPFMDNMVIQRYSSINVRGKGPNNQLIIVNFDKEVYYGVSNNDGIFDIEIPQKSTCKTPFDIIVTNGLGVETTITNVLIGDVYLFAGQSNMQWPTNQSDYTRQDVVNAKNQNLRFFCQDVVQSPTKLESVKNGRWFMVNDTNYQYFSAIAFMSGSILAKAICNDVPIGIITAYQGDTNIANWMDSEYYTGTSNTKTLHYNAMVYPLRHTKLSGVVWYQGCNNSAAGGDYEEHLLKLFENYRDLFNSPNTPFYVIGLACYDGDNGNNYDFSYVRESQAIACSKDPNAYFISSCDDGDPTYIHPSTKHYICERVAKSILGSNYGQSFSTSGPTYKEHIIDGNKVIITFDNSKGLYSKGEITNLYLAGDDGKYYPAVGTIENDKLIAVSSQVSNPKYIKYGFGKSPFVNIFNSDDFSMTPFRTDERNTNIDLFDYTSTNEYTTHPDGSKMTTTIDNNILKISKAGDGKTYGSIRLNKWGMIAYNPEGFRFTIIGTNSNASISLRFIEGGSFEIWSYKVVDNFIGEKTFEIYMSDFICTFNKQDNKLDTQRIQYIELMIETSKAVTVNLKEARFINIERTKPTDFTISNATELENEISINLSKSIFAESYSVIVSKDGNNFSNPVYEQTQNDVTFKFSKSILEKGIPYYIKATASNELGDTTATNSGYIFYLNDDQVLIVCNFDFKDQQALEAYIASSMSVHSGLKSELTENGVKITTSSQGWQQFIFKLDPSTATGTTKLRFYADFTNYQGKVILQLADTNYNVYQYVIDTSVKKEGIFEIDFSSFIKSPSTPFTTQTLMWVMFNFEDYLGNGIIILDDVNLLK